MHCTLEHRRLHGLMAEKQNMVRVLLKHTCTKNRNAVVETHSPVFICSSKFLEMNANHLSTVPVLGQAQLR